MNELNYHHLYYFWIVAKEGSVTQASQKLFVSQSTVSGQLALLEEQIGAPLFERRGRHLELTETGQIAYSYACDIFPLGNEMVRALKGQHQTKLLTLTVGVANVLPKLLVHRFLQPVAKSPDKIRLVFIEDNLTTLLSELALHRLDVVLSDAPASGGARARIYNHLLGESGIEFFAHPTLARKLARKFPQSLENAPVLLPSLGTDLRRSIDHWFEKARVTPQIMGEFDDSALMKIYGQAGLGAFPAPSIVAEEVIRQYKVLKIGDAPTIRERFYAISMERKLKHPAVVAITESARESLI
ncbi:MAG: transcriptional activator NhaR [Planctomycetota bacterium]